MNELFKLLTEDLTLNTESWSWIQLGISRVANLKNLSSIKPEICCYLFYKNQMNILVLLHLLQ